MGCSTPSGLPRQLLKARGEEGERRLMAPQASRPSPGKPESEKLAATKGGLISMAKALSVEYARYGVTAHTILPGWIETEMTEGAFGNDKFVTAVHKRIPCPALGPAGTSPVSRFTS